MIYIYHNVSLDNVINLRGLRKMFAAFQSWKANKSLMSPFFVERWCKCLVFMGVS